MKVTIQKKPKATLEVTITVPQDKVKESYDQIFAEVIKGAEIKGFRKGQAPAEMVREKTDVSKLYGEIVNNLLQTYYPQALKENHIMPVANPQVEIKEFDLEKDFIFVATVAVRPEVEVGDYKKEIKKIFDDKTEEARKLNAEKLKAGEQITHDHAHLTPDDVLDGILKVTKVEFSDILVADETDRLMTRLVDQAQTIGLSLEQYLKTHNKTAESLRKEYDEISTRNLSAEFALSKIIETEKVDVSDSEVDAMINASGDSKTSEMMNTLQNRLYIKSMLLKNKLITSIINEIEGDLHKEETNDEK